MALTKELKSSCEKFRAEATEIDDETGVDSLRAVLTETNSLSALNNVVAAIEALSKKVEKVEVKVEKVGQAVADNGFETRTALNAILDLAGENNELLRGECAARERIEKKRKHDKEYRRATRAVARQTTTERETEKEKEPSPHTPYKEENKEKERAHTHHARAREGIPSVEEVAAEVEATGSNIDPEYFVDFYLAHPKKVLGDWKAMLRNWTKNPIESGRIKIVKKSKKVSEKEFLRKLEEEAQQQMKEMEAKYGNQG